MIESTLSAFGKIRDTHHCCNDFLYLFVCYLSVDFLLTLSFLSLYLLLLQLIPCLVKLVQVFTLGEDEHEVSFNLLLLSLTDHISTLAVFEVHNEHGYDHPKAAHHLEVINDQSRKVNSLMPL